jgi:hypothetical protein
LQLGGCRWVVVRSRVSAPLAAPTSLKADLDNKRTLDPTKTTGNWRFSARAPDELPLLLAEPTPVEHVGGTMITIAYALTASLAKLPSSPEIASAAQGTALVSSTSSGGSSITSIIPLASVVLEVLFLFVIVAVVGLFIIIVVANRADPDPSGRRPQSVYYFAVSLVTLVTTIIGSMVIVFSLVELIGNHAPHIGNSIARAAVLGGLVTLVAGVLLRTHLRRGVSLAVSEAANPSRRVAQSYVSAVSFISILVALVATVLVIYLLFVLAAPGVFGSLGGRTTVLRDLLDLVYSDVVAGTVLLTHRNLVSPGLQLFGTPRARHAFSDPTAPTAAPPLGSVS